jgi:hypothetical protein
MTNCNICGQGEYVITAQTEFETIAEPVYENVSTEETTLEEI